MRLRFSSGCDTKSLMYLLCLNIQDIAQCSAIDTLLMRGLSHRAVQSVQSSQNKIILPEMVTAKPRGEARSGARVNDMENACELLINVVRTNKPKMLTGLNQKASGWHRGSPNMVQVTAPF